MRTPPPAIDVDRRVEPETIPLMERLAHWDKTNIETIRGAHRAIRPAPVPADPRVQRSGEVITGTAGRPDVHIRVTAQPAHPGHSPVFPTSTVAPTSWARSRRTTTGWIRW